MKDPKPRVLFKKIADSAMEFELVAFVGDVDVALQVNSDLHFSIFQAMRDAQVPPPGGKTVVEGIDRLDARLEQLTAMMGKDAAPQKSAPAPAAPDKLPAPPPPKQSEPPSVI
ncbi:MAG: hypothetical protein ACRCTD_14745, partial [Beijerinckiaceae bacterium]